MSVFFSCFAYKSRDGQPKLVDTLLRPSPSHPCSPVIITHHFNRPFSSDLHIPQLSNPRLDRFRDPCYGSSKRHLHFVSNSCLVSPPNPSPSALPTSSDEHMPRQFARQYEDSLIYRTGRPGFHAFPKGGLTFRRSR